MGTRQSRPQAQQTHWWNEEKQPEATEKCYNPTDPLTFVEGDDEMDFLCIGYTSLRARMSCGHTVTPTSLTVWCRRQLDEGSMKFVCGLPNCDAEWTYEEVCKMALLTQEENTYFENKLFRNSINVTQDVKSCPGCKCRVVREDPNDLCVICPKCSTNSQPFIFCWQCLKKWKGPAPASYHCENDDCCYEKQRILENCPIRNFKRVAGVKGCPCIRACPACGFLLEHSGQNFIS
uniref:IBR domain-containing protein n=1 Tax=Knipowitschia caucasica TaxID=637954 RepID=A0AAV2KRY1_KNICA